MTRSRSAGALPERSCERQTRVSGLGVYRQRLAALLLRSTILCALTNAANERYEMTDEQRIRALEAMKHYLSAPPAADGPFFF